jgi:hypothetical protein
LTKDDNSLSNCVSEKPVDAVVLEGDVAGVAMVAIALRVISVFVKCSIRHPMLQPDSQLLHS